MFLIIMTCGLLVGSVCSIQSKERLLKAFHDSDRVEIRYNYSQPSIGYTVATYPEMHRSCILKLNTNFQLSKGLRPRAANPLPKK